MATYSVDDVYKALSMQVTQSAGEQCREFLRVTQGEMSKEQFSDNLRRYALSFFEDSASGADVGTAVDRLLDNLFGYSILTPLIEDAQISDIDIYGWDRILIKKDGKRSLSDIRFASPTDFEAFIQQVTTRNKISASTRNSIARFTDVATSNRFTLRFTLITKFLTSPWAPALAIRKTPIDFPDTAELINRGMLTRAEADTILDLWRQGSLIVCGAMSAGKTSLLNALKEELPHDKTVGIFQQSLELRPKSHPMMLCCHTFETDGGESDVNYGLKELTIGGLTMDLDYIIIGEVKGGEARYIINSSYTGTPCGLTIHSGSAETAPYKLVDYALTDHSEYTRSEFVSMLEGFKAVVFLKDYKVTQIREIVGIEDGKIIYRKIK